MSSLVGVEPTTPAVVERHSILAEHPLKHGETSILQLCWKNRWLILFLMAIGGGTAWVFVQRVVPLYTSVSRICVERNLPAFLRLTVNNRIVGFPLHAGRIDSVNVRARRCGRCSREFGA